jgi:hypothetical protein
MNDPTDREAEAQAYITMLKGMGFNKVYYSLRVIQGKSGGQIEVKGDAYLTDTADRSGVGLDIEWHDSIDAHVDLLRRIVETVADSPEYFSYLKEQLK